jgi:quinol monooxygenase YgiN
MNITKHLSKLYLLYCQSTSQGLDRLHAGCKLRSGTSFQIRVLETFIQQPGFISAQSHRGIAGSSTFVNYVVWESAAHFRQAFNRPEIQSNMASVLPNTVMSPHLFKKVAVPGICVD